MYSMASPAVALSLKDTSSTPLKIKNKNETVSARQNQGDTALGWFDVRAYGAMGDGTTDDTKALQAAFDAVPATGGTVYIPAGVYLAKPSKGLTPKANTVILGDGYSSVIKVPNGHNTTGNLLRVTNCDHITVTRIRLDGSRGSQKDAKNYGLFFDSCVDARIDTVWVHSFNGVGIQAYNCDSCVVANCASWDNEYHGFECEQCRGCTFTGNSGHHNDRHGIFVSPGEVGGSGSLNNVIMGNSFHENSEYGICLGEDAGNRSAFLSTGNMIAVNSVHKNKIYGIQLWKVNGNTVQGNSVSGNGRYGIHVFQSANNIIMGNTLAANCHAVDNSYDELIIEGYAYNHDRPSRYNIVSNNTIHASGINQPRYGINEASVDDGPNTIVHNTMTGTFGTAAIHTQDGKETPTCGCLTNVGDSED